MMTNKPTKYYLANKLNQIRRLLDQGEKGKGISKKMNIPLRTTERYIQRVYQQEKEKWSEIANESLENRALKIKSHYERLAKISESILHDESKSPRDRIEAGKTIIACHNNVYNMIKYGPLKISIEINPLEEQSCK